MKKELTLQEKTNRVKEIIHNNWDEWMENLIWYWAEEREHNIKDIDITTMEYELAYAGYVECWKYDPDGFEWELINWAIEEAEKQGIRFTDDELDSIYRNDELCDLQIKFYTEATEKLNKKLVNYLKELFSNCQVEAFHNKIIIERRNKKEEGAGE